MISDITAQLVAFDPTDGDAREFDALLARCFETLEPREAAEALIRLLEDHPEEDGAPYWGIVHGLEAYGDYEDLLRDSIGRTPSFFGVLLANRMLNAGEGEDWIPEAFDALLRSGTASPRVTQIVSKFVAARAKTNGEQGGAPNP